MRKSLGLLSMMAMASMLEDDGSRRSRIAEEDNEKARSNPSPKLPDPPIPKGCKEYCFNEYGKIVKGECYFKCVSSNYKTAIKKFNKYEKFKNK